MNYYFTKKNKMMLFSTNSSRFYRREPFSEISKSLKVFGISLFITCLNLNAYSSAQIVTIDSKEVTLQKVFREIYRQTGYQFFYEDALLDRAGKINLSVQGKTLEETLAMIFKYLPLSYSINNKTIIVSALKKDNSYLGMNERKEYLRADPIKGKITNAAGEPMIGVTVMASSSQKGTISDLNGNYSIQIETGDEALIFSYIGYVTRSVTIEGQSNIDIILVEEPFVLEEVSIVATGYQQLSKERSTGSFSLVKSEDFNVKSNSMSVIDRLEGLVPGLAVNYGRNSEKFLIRGLTSVNAGKSPLIVVDGVPIFDGSTMTSLVNPDDVETITLLRDATAASIWGAAAANGVIVITTKKGKTSAAPQKIQVNYNGFVSYRGVPDLDYYNLMNSSQLVQAGKDIFDASAFPWAVVTTAASNNSTPIVAPHEQVLYDLSRKVIGADIAQQRFDSLGSLNNRAQLRAFLQQPSKLSNHSINFNGGSPFHSFYGSLAYTRDENFTKTNLDRYQLNLRQDFIFSKAVQLDLTTNIAFEKNDRFLLTDFPGTINTLLPYAMLSDKSDNPLSLAYLTRHQPFRTTSENQSRINLDYVPLLEPDNTKNGNISLSTRINAGLRINIVKGLTYESRAQYQRNSVNAFDYYNQDSYRVRNERVFFTQAPTTATGNPTYFLPVSGGHYLTNNNTQYAWTARNQLLYENGKNEDHQITFLAGTELRADLSEKLGTFKRGFDFQTLTYSYIDELFLGSTGVTNPVNFLPSRTINILNVNQHTYSEVERRFFSLYGNGAYTFKGKYTLNGSIRMDQSNLFGSDPAAQYKPVWSIGGAWNLTRETFFSPDIVDQLKLRLTYGLSGNAPVPGQGGPFDIIGARNSAIFAGLGTGYVVFTPANDLLTWERTKTINVGVDFSLWNQKFSGSIDVYDKHTTDLLGFIPIDPTTGFSYAYDNLGSLKNRGIEVQLNSFHFKRKDFSWRTVLTLSMNRNEILSLKRSSALTFNNKLSGVQIEGYSAYPLFGYNYIGLDKAGNPMALSATKDTLRLANQIKLDDPSYSGTTQPLWYGGITNLVSYKNFSLSFLVIFNLGHQMRLDVNRFYTGRLLTNLPDYFENRWKKEGDEQNTDIPKYIANSSTSTTQRNTNFYTQGLSNIASASYAKLRDLTINYQIGKKIADKLSMRDLTIYGQVNNILLWTKNRNHIDPEYFDYQQGVRLDRMPAFYTFGLRASFK
jgi:TonB-linked SusC/RagA family outer membrane protein